MKLPNLNEARIRTKKEIEHIHLEQKYDEKYNLMLYAVLEDGTKIKIDI